MASRIVWIAGMPRAGSMWTYNVTRKLLQEAGRYVLPEAVPNNDAEMVACARRARYEPDDNAVHVLKVHSRLEPWADSSYYITNVRDVRDALVSWIRFMLAGFELALEQAVDMTRSIGHYRTFPPDRMLRIEYATTSSVPQQCAGESRRVSSWISQMSSSIWSATCTASRMSAG